MPLTQAGIGGNRSAERITLRVPVMVIVLAATAIPVEWVPQGHNPLSVGVKIVDALVNIAGYVPIGIVLGELRLLPAVITAALMSTLAESGQSVMLHRDPSVVDVAANVIGAILGTIICALWRIRSPAFRITKRRALAAAALAATLFLGVWATSADATNARGVTEPGRLEAHWAFDGESGQVATDSSGHGLRGRFIHEPARVTGVIGNAVNLTSARDYVDFGRSTAFRLVGSMTVSAWIRSTAFPVDDAAIVSNLKHNVLADSDAGFQLDTTIDRGPRTIGFKLGDSCGKHMARYGATPIRLDTWYHVAGVYDAETQTLDVYLNGELDNGVLIGPVGAARRSPREPLLVGRRSDLEGFPFTGAIDDVRIYSLALTKAEIVAMMGGASVDRPAGQHTSETDLAGRRSAGRLGSRGATCDWSSEFEDARIPGAVAVLGVLVAVAGIGLWPSARPWQWLVVGLLAGRLLLLVASGTLPSLNAWTFPLTSLAGAVSVVVSLRRGNEPVRHVAE